MARNKFPKSVSFNQKNAADQAILKHVRKRNFSGYVKKLILADMAQAAAPKETTTTLSKFEQLQAELNRRTDDISSNPQHNPDTQSDH